MIEQDGRTAESAPSSREAELARELAETRAALEAMSAEFADLKLLYEATIEHGEAVEDQLAENNILLQRTQARLAAELQDASRYLFSTLPAPREGPPATDWLLIPSTELGGDSLGFHEIDDEHMAFYLLDVCGHGVGAALLSATVTNVLRTSALPQVDFRDPSAVLSALNDAFPMEKQNDMFFTIWYGVYERGRSAIRFATAGHPPAIHLSGDVSGRTAARPLMTPGGMAIGAVPDVLFETTEAAIRPGDRVLVVSDGTFEVDGPDGEMLSFDALMAFCVGHGCDSPASVLDWIRSFSGGGALPDDFSLMRIAF